MRNAAQLYFWLALAQAAHSIEEILAGLYDFFWIATGRLHEVFPAFPQFRMSAETFGAINLALVALLLGIAPSVAAGRPWARWLAGIAAVVEILNGTGHLAGTVVFGGYVPGAGTAPFLLVLGILTLRALRQGSPCA